MHSLDNEKTSTNRFFSDFVECLTVTMFCVALVTTLLYIMKADGFTHHLTAWIICSCVLFYTTHRFTIRIRWIWYVLRILSVVFVIGGAIVLLVQLGAAQRSLAEVWLSYMRKGEPFGFFSFFAVEIYSFVLIVAVFFAASKKYLISLCLAVALQVVCAALLSGEPYLFVGAFIIAVIPLLPKRRWQPFVFPAAIAILLSWGCAFWGQPFVESGTFDFSRIMSVIAPDFPLMVHIPGYGYTVKASRPTPSVILSSRPIFSIRGEPEKSLYFSNDHFFMWAGSEWLHSDITATVPNVHIFTPGNQSSMANHDDFPSDTKRIHLRLIDDFYSIVPCTDDTFAVQIPNEYSDSERSASGADAFFLQPGMHRGAEITLFTAMSVSGKKDTVNVPNEGTRFKYITNGAVIPLRIKALARATAGDDFTVLTTAGHDVTPDVYSAAVRRYVANILTFFTENGFTYSLETPAAPEGKDPFEYFLFETKTGFCSWFAGSFTLLMHAVNIPCRLTEGYRVTLDGTGLGVLSGVHAHAWPEVFVDGAWRIFESTPVFFSANPFAYIDGRDSRALAQVAELSNGTMHIPENDKNVTVFDFSVLYPWLVGLVVLGVLFFIGALLRVLCNSERRLVFSARRMVKRYATKGIASPTEIGWLAWKQAVSLVPITNRDTTNERDRALATANQMITRLYAHTDKKDGV